MKRQLMRTGLGIGVAALIAAGIFYRGAFDPAGLDAFVSGLGSAAPAAFVVLYALGAIAFAPGSLFALAGGALFGPLAGTVLNLAGATFGASLSFLIARYIAGDAVAARAGGCLEQLLKGVEAEGWRFVAFVRLVPVFPFNLSNYALGLTRIGFLPYVLTTFIAMIPGAAAYTWLGHAGRSALAGDSAAVRYGIVALGLLAAIAFLPRLVRRMRRQGVPADETNWIDISQLEACLRGPEFPVLVDVRGADEFNGPLGHIAGAANIPAGEIDARLAEITSKGRRPVYLICRTDRRSAAVAAKLKNAGLAELHVVRGGMEEWNRAGLPAERG